MDQPVLSAPPIASTPPVRPRVALFVTCLVDLYRPTVGFAAIRLLERAGCQVEVPRAQTCCGQPAYNSGDRATATDLARDILDAFGGFDYVVVPSGSCGGMLGNAIYPYFKQRCSNVLPTDIQIEPDEHAWLSYLDVRDGDAMRRAFTDFKPDLVLHLAALVDVEHCELQPLEAKVTNATAAKIAADEGSAQLLP